MEEQRSAKLGRTGLMIGGILLVIIGIVFIFLKDYKEACIQIILGITFIFGGMSFSKPTIKWKEMPTGMKLLVIFLLIRYFSGIVTIYTKLESYEMLFGFPLQFPISIIIKLVMPIIALLVLIAIYRRTWWKLILWLEGLTIINFLIGCIWMMVTPLSKVFAISGQNITTTITPQVETLTKVITSIPLLAVLSIDIIIFVYIFKHKDYFQNANN